MVLCGSRQIPVQIAGRQVAAGRSGSATDRVEHGLGRRELVALAFVRFEPGRGARGGPRTEPRVAELEELLLADQAQVARG
jgi:hypothetical protein